MGDFDLARMLIEAEWYRQEREWDEESRRDREREERAYEEMLKRNAERQIDTFVKSESEDSMDKSYAFIYRSKIRARLVAIYKSRIGDMSSPSIFASVRCTRREDSDGFIHDTIPVSDLCSIDSTQMQNAVRKSRGKWPHIK